MKRPISLFWGILVSLSLMGQNVPSATQLDSLTQLLAEADKDTLKHDLHFELGKAYQYVQPNKSAIHLTESIKLARQMGDKKRLWSGLVTLGFLYSTTGEPAKSMVLLQEALLFSESVNEGANMPLAFIANNYEVQGDLINALEYAKRSYRIYDERYKLGLKVDERGYVATPMRVGQLFEKTGQLDSAMYYAQMSYQRLLEKPSVVLFPFFYCSVCTLLGNLYSRQKDSNQAVGFYHIAINKGIEANYPYNVNESRSALAIFYYKNHQLDSAIYYARQAYESAKKIKTFVIMKESAALLRSVYEEEKDFENALYYNDLSVAARDSISGAEKVREVQALTFKEEQRQQKILQDIETERIAYQNRNKMYALSFILGGLLLLVIGGSIFTFYRFQLNQRFQQAEAMRLKELDAVKTKLYTNITHEFRTPLTVILGIAQQIKDAPNEFMQEGLGMIKRNGQNLLNLVNQILDLSKLESGKLTLHYQRSDMVTFMHYLVESFHSFAESKSVKIHFISDLEELTMDFDETYLQQIVSNLLTNAVKFTPKSGDIYVSLGIQSTTFSFKVRDTGVGISEANLPLIFDRFYEVDDSTTRHGEGTGIGLSLTRELVKLMEGTISVKSQLNKGTEFEVILPIQHIENLKIAHEKPLQTEIMAMDTTVSEEEMTISIATYNAEKRLLKIGLLPF